MKQHKQWQGAMVGVLASFVISSAAWAGDPTENRLPDWGDYGAKTIDFTNVAINYKAGKRRWGRQRAGSFFGHSQSNSPWSNASVEPSTFSLNSLHDGYDNVAFDGDMIIDAKISAKGRLNTRNSKFGIFSNDPMFEGPVVNYDCGRRGCRSGVLVYGGELTDFGWSGSQGILEFEIGNLSGWAWDQWESSSRDGATSKEHLFLDIGKFNLNGRDSIKSFNTVANGFAVVPVPAAVWLFGSGLIGLIGFARRKRT